MAQFGPDPVLAGFYPDLALMEGLALVGLVWPWAGLTLLALPWRGLTAVPGLGLGSLAGPWAWIDKVCSGWTR